MDNASIFILASLLGIAVSICSITAFYIGRKKEAVGEGKANGVLETDIKNISTQLKEMKEAFDKLSGKMDMVDEKRESEYRAMLIKTTELDASYKSLHRRVDEVEKRLN